jgi:hypothetical protein
MIEPDSELWAFAFWMYLLCGVGLTVLIPFLPLPLSAKVVAGVADVAAYLLAINARTGWFLGL